MSASVNFPKRKHVTTACISCRESKVKCDGQTPSCSTCEARGRECFYRAGDDKRKLSVRLAVGILSARIDELCQFIVDNSMRPPPLDEEQEATLNKVLTNLRLSDLISRRESLGEAPPPQFATNNNDTCNTEGNIDNSHGNPEHFDHAAEENQSQNWGWNDFGGDVLFDEYVQTLPVNTTEDLLPSQPTALSTTSAEGDGAIISPAEPQSGADNGSEALVRQLSDRMESLQIDPGGQVRYYGPTSDFYLVDLPPPDNLTVHRTVRNDGREYLERLGLEKEADAELRAHLTNLYFTWQDPAMHVVDRVMYEAAETQCHKTQKDTPYFSESLQNAIYALGAAFEARYHPTFVTYPKSLSDFFADRAKTLLEIELDCPSIATVQAMVVLSGHDVGCKRDARGWLYSGMAMRLSFDLALHVDMTPYVQSGKITQAEVELRQVVFWGAYAVDHMWGFFLGRPSRVNIEGVTVLKPGSLSGGHIDERWTPYTSKLTDKAKSLADDVNLLSRHRATLWNIMAPVESGIYDSTRIAASTLHGIYSQAIDKLWEWKANLPPMFQVDLRDKQSPYLPHVLLLHMQFHQHIIHTHRPLMSTAFAHTTDFEYGGYVQARTTCVRSAIAIANLLKIYEDQYTLQQVNVQAVAYTGSAALFLVFAVATNFQLQEESESAGLHLTTCLRALDLFGLSWENAKRVRDFLTILQRKWELQARASRQGRGSVGLPEDDPSPRKRTRTSTSMRQPNMSWLSSAPVDGDLHVPGVIANDLPIDLDWVFTGDAFRKAT